MQSVRIALSNQAPRARPSCSGLTTRPSARPTAWLPKTTRSWEPTAGDCCFVTRTITERSSFHWPRTARVRLRAGLSQGADLFELQRVADHLTGKGEHPVHLVVHDTSGRPVPGVEVVLAKGGKPEAWGRTDQKGSISINTGGTPGTLTVSAPGRGSKAIALAPDVPASLSDELLEAGAVEATITDLQGGNPFRAAVQFLGRAGTSNPNFGPDTGEHAIKNVYYSHDGRFRRELPPGSYDVIISYGPEYDAVFTRLDVTRGKEMPLTAEVGPLDKV